MSKYIGTMIVWIAGIGLLLFIVRHSSDIVQGFTYLINGGNLQGLFQGVDSLFK